MAGALALALVLAGALAIFFTPQPAQAAGERVEVRCADPGVDTGCTEEMLRTLIAEAGSTPTRIVLGRNSDDMSHIDITQTLVIPAGADIELVNLPDQSFAWGSLVHNASLLRAPGFTGVMVRIEDGGALTLSNVE